MKKVFVSVVVALVGLFTSNASACDRVAIGVGYVPSLGFSSGYAFSAAPVLAAAPCDPTPVVAYSAPIPVTYSLPVAAFAPVPTLYSSYAVGFPTYGLGFGGYGVGFRTGFGYGVGFRGGFSTLPAYGVGFGVGRPLSSRDFANARFQATGQVSRLHLAGIPHVR